MKKLGLAAMLCVSVCLLAGCRGNVKTLPQSSQSSEAEASYQGVDVTPGELAEQIQVENISPYEGIFLEGEEKDRVEDAYALKVTNVSEKTILHATLNYRAGNKNLIFYFFLPFYLVIAVHILHFENNDRSQHLLAPIVVFYSSSPIGRRKLSAISCTPRRKP